MNIQSTHIHTHGVRSHDTILPCGIISGFFSMLSILSVHKSRTRPTSCDDCNVRCAFNAYDAISARSLLLPPIDESLKMPFVVLLLPPLLPPPSRFLRMRTITRIMIAISTTLPAHPDSNGNNDLILAMAGVDASNDDVSVCFSGLFSVNTWRTVELLRPFAFWAIKNTL